MKRLLLIGGGHAHLFVLRRIASSKPADVEVMLVSPSRWQHYSGMVPGWMAGHYRDEDIRIDLAALAEQAGVKFVTASMRHLVTEGQFVSLSDGSRQSYDLISIDIGSETRNTDLEDCGDRLLTIKPLDAFQARWCMAVQAAADRERFELVVVGAGAAGVELALAANVALKRVCRAARVRLISGASGFLHGHDKGVKMRVTQALRRAGIERIDRRATGTTAGVRLDSGEDLSADAVLAATGAAAAPLLRDSGLDLDADGFIRVDSCHRSLSHNNVFATGDVSSRQDPNFQRSGVHAVHAGPVLAGNLLAALSGGALDHYVPRKSVLYLLACGEKNAIASWGRFHAEGRWVWQWKDFIDRRFMTRFSN